MKEFKLDPDLQMVPTVKKDQYTVEEAVVKGASEIMQVLEKAGITVRGDGIHQLQVEVNGKVLYYQMVGYRPSINLQGNE